VAQGRIPGLNFSTAVNWPAAIHDGNGQHPGQYTAGARFEYSGPN
jgi:hypothetical protein